MKKATTKRERKYGKKESEVVKKPKSKDSVIMYRILIDRANFTKPMTYDKCMAYIEDKNKQATRENRRAPLMTLVQI